MSNVIITNNNSGPRWVMTPEEQAIALQEAKARGLPDGWRVELDVRCYSCKGLVAAILAVAYGQVLITWNAIFYLWTLFINLHISSLYLSSSICAL